MILLVVALAGWGVAACGGSSGKERSAAAQRPSHSTMAARRTRKPAVHGVTVREPSRALGLLADEDDDDQRTIRVMNARHDDDADFDNDSKPASQGAFFDDDDAIVRDYGRPASAADARAITALVKRYYAASSRADGRRVCGLLFSLTAEAVPEDYGRGAGPAFARGNTCSAVLSKYYRHEHAMVAGSVQVVAVRVEGKRALALIGSRTMPASSLPVRSEYGVWKLYALFSRRLP